MEFKALPGGERYKKIKDYSLFSKYPELKIKQKEYLEKEGVALAFNKKGSNFRVQDNRFIWLPPFENSL